MLDGISRSHSKLITSITISLSQTLRRIKILIFNQNFFNSMGVSRRCRLTLVKLSIQSSSFESSEIWRLVWLCRIILPERLVDWTCCFIAQFGEYQKNRDSFVWNAAILDTRALLFNTNFSVTELSTLQNLLAFHQLATQVQLSFYNSGGRS